MKRRAELELEGYQQWCINNERPMELRQSLVDYCEYADIDNDTYAELCDILDVVDMDSDTSEYNPETSDTISQDDIDSLLGDDRHYDEAALVNLFAKNHFNESFGGDKAVIIRFMKDHNIDVADDNEFISDFMMAFGHGPYNYKPDDLDTSDDAYLF